MAGITRKYYKKVVVAIRVGIRYSTENSVVVFPLSFTSHRNCVMTQLYSDVNFYSEFLTLVVVRWLMTSPFDKYKVQSGRDIHPFIHPFIYLLYILYTQDSI